MERVGIFFKLKKGKREEYKTRHDNIWPEMTKALEQAGVHNYAIWNFESMLFAYFETDDYELSQQLLEKNEAYQKWRKYMEDIIDFNE